MKHLFFLYGFLLMISAAGIVLIPSVNAELYDIYGEWFQIDAVPPLHPYDDQGLAYVASENSIYMAQGNNSGGKGFARYDISSGTWTTLTSSPHGLHGGNVLYEGGNYIYAIGYYNGNHLNRYDISGDSWTTLAGPPYDCRHNGAVIAQGHIYCIKSSGDTFYRYSIAGNSWTTRASVPGNCTHGSMAYDGGDNIYVTLGGTSSSFYRYSISGNSWTGLASTPGTSTYQAGLHLENYLFWVRSGQTNDFWAYDIESDAWYDDLPVIPSDIYVTEFFATDGEDLYLINSSQNMDGKFYRYDLEHLQPTPTFTITATRTSTASPTLTPTDSPTFSPTHSPTLTSTMVPTETPTASSTVTPTLTPTASPTLTPTSSPTSSSTPSATPTITLTPTQTESPTAAPVPATTSAGCFIITAALGLLLLQRIKRNH